MSEHYTQGRQGQGARHRRRYNANRNYRHRMPRPEEPKPSLFKRVLSFFGIGSQSDRKKKEGKQNKNHPPQRVRVAQSRAPRSGNPAAAKKQRRRSVSTPPTENGRLYVGNLSFETTEPELEDLFKGFGRVRSVEIVYNSHTYRSKGYAFVEMEELADAKRAAEELHGQPFMGRELRVSAANEKARHSDDDEPAMGIPDRKDDADEQGADGFAFGEEVVVKLPETEPVAQSPQV